MYEAGPEDIVMNERGMEILTEANERRNHMNASAGAFCVTGRGA